MRKDFKGRHRTNLGNLGHRVREALLKERDAKRTCLLPPRLFLLQSQCQENPAATSSRCQNMSRNLGVCVCVRN